MDVNVLPIFARRDPLWTWLAEIYGCAVRDAAWSKWQCRHKEEEVDDP
jgi:hypothetical protein